MHLHRLLHPHRCAARNDTACNSADSYEAAVTSPDAVSWDMLSSTVCQTSALFDSDLSSSVVFTDVLLETMYQGVALRFQIQVRTLLLLMAVAAVGCKLFVMYRNDRERIEHIRLIQSHGGEVRTTFAIPPFVGNVTEITVSGDKLSDHFAVAREFDRFKHLRMLRVTNFVRIGNSVRRKQPPETLTFDCKGQVDIEEAVRFVCRNGI